jgi:hypothetical protein
MFSSEIGLPANLSAKCAVSSARKIKSNSPKARCTGPKTAGGKARSAAELKCEAARQGRTMSELVRWVLVMSASKNGVANQP